MNAYREIIESVDTMEHELRAISQAIHRHPEMGYSEFKAAALLEKRLRDHGFTAARPLRDMPTALTAYYGRRGSRPAIAFPGEYDALPEIGHGCGHNLIAAAAFGAAAALAPFTDKFGGSVWFFGTPAEEYDGGKIPMVQAGLFNDIDAALMMHPECLYLVNTAALAMDALQFTFKGKAAHASATPHEGINALDAVILLFNGISVLRQQLLPEVRIHGIITKGGTYPNIIPDHTEARFYIRAAKRSHLNRVAEKVRNCARGAAKATGCRLSIVPFERSNDNLVNNPLLSALIERHLRALGIHEIAECDLEPGSSDFGNVSHMVPSAYFYAATAPPGMALHTREFARSAVAEKAYGALMTSVKAMACTGLDILQNPEPHMKAADALRKDRESPVR